MTPAALVADLQARGVTLEPRGDRLAVRPAPLVTDAELEILRQHKPEILALLATVRIFNAEVVEILPRAEGDRKSQHPADPQPPPALARAWRYPWPDHLPGLGANMVGPSELCATCACGTWARYGTTALCFRCATARAPGGRP